MCFVSFIVPVYNLERKVVDKCIDSILNQSFKNYEIIIVDDGSNNGIQNYCDELSVSYKIKVIHQSNSGLAVARNAGMLAATGDWIVHVDGDDWVDEHLSELLYNSVSGRSVDIVVWGFVRSSAVVNQVLLLRDKSIFDNSFESIREKAICSILGNDTSFDSLALNTSWGKAYNSKFIKNKKLYYNPSLRRAQDAVYNLYTFNCATNVIYIDKALSFYRVDNVSLSRGYNSKTLIYLTQTALAAKEFSMRNNISSSVCKSTELFVRRCFRIINEQYIQHRDNPMSIREKIKLFNSTINSEPFRSAFDASISSPKLTIRIMDYLIKHESYLCLLVFRYVQYIMSATKAILNSFLKQYN